MTAENQLFGYELPFPRQDLYVALIAVLAFIPAVVLLNSLVRWRGETLLSAAL